MPFVIPGIIAGISAAAGAFATGATIFGLTGLQAALVIGAITTVVSIGGTLLQQALAKSKGPSIPDFNAQSQALTRSVRISAQPRRYVYGETRVGGNVVFIKTSETLVGPNGATQFAAGGTVKNKYLHMVIALAAHEIEAIRTIFIDDYPIYEDDIEAYGIVNNTNRADYKYGQQIRVAKYLGTSAQTADPDLVAQFPDLWSTDHRGREQAYLYIMLIYDGSTFGGGIPNVTVVVRGKKVEDPREGASPSVYRYTPNSILCTRDLLLTSYHKGGIGAVPANLNDTIAASEANTCDEFVPTQEIATDVYSVDATNNTIDLNCEINPYQTGDRVHIRTVDSPAVIPSGLAGSPNVYYVEVTKERQRREKDGSPITHRPQIKLYSTYAAALAASSPISLGSTGSATFQIVKDGEPRYACAYLYEAGGRAWRQKALADLLSSMAGYAINVGGYWNILAAQWRAPEVTFDENDFRGQIATPTRISRRERFNAVQGKYADPVNLWTSDSWPSFKSAEFEAADVLGRKFGLLDLPATPRPQTCRRLAKIHLYRHRKQLHATLPLKIVGMKVQAGLTFMLDNTVRGMSGFQMEAIEWTLRSDGDPPAVVTEIEARETGSDIYAWDHTSEEQAPITKQLLNLPKAGQPVAPGVPSIVEAIYEGREGSDVQTVVTMSWSSSADNSVEWYELQYGAVDAADDDFLPFGPSVVSKDKLQGDHINIDPGTYTFRVRAINNLGGKSDWSEADVTIVGLSAAPSAPTGFSIQKLGGQALAKWDLHPEADVRRGGWIEFRHSPSTSETNAANATSIGSEDGRVPGRDTVANLPLKSGTYFARAIDKLEEKSDWVYFSTDGAEQVSYAASTEIEEHPTFAGVKENFAVSGSSLVLTGSLLMDSWGLVDDVANWDYEGGIASYGIYNFSATLDSGNTNPKRVRGHLSASVFNAFNTIDQRTTNIDTWESFDGDSEAGGADAWIEFRETDTDPTISPGPGWTEWARLDVTQSTKRYFQFRIRAQSHDTSFNIQITEAAAYIETVV